MKVGRLVVFAGCDLLVYCEAINRVTNGTNGFDNTVLFTALSDDHVFPGLIVSSGLEIIWVLLPQD